MEEREGLRWPQVKRSAKSELKQSTTSLIFKYNRAIKAPPIWGMWWEATLSLLMWFMRSPEGLEKLDPSVGATYYSNTHLFSWLISTSILKGLQPRCYFDSFWEQNQNKNGREKKDDHPPNKLVSKTQVYNTEASFCPDTRLCSYTDFSTVA